MKYTRIKGNDPVSRPVRLRPTKKDQKTNNNKDEAHKMLLAVCQTKGFYTEERKGIE